jgi:hypothetical protein
MKQKEFEFFQPEARFQLCLGSQMIVPEFMDYRSQQVKTSTCRFLMLVSLTKTRKTGCKGRYTITLY